MMGFGMYPSSGIAQRFSHALLWITLQRFDASEGALLDAEMDPLRVQYLQDRAALGPNQRVLWDADCYTDDTYIAVVGAARAARMLMTWGGVTTAVGAVTKAIKRQAGSCILWNGAYTNAFLANQVIPPDKALRASSTLMDIGNDVPVIFSVYRSVMGLVVHLKQLLRGRRMSLYGMFRPYLRGILHPAAPIHAPAALKAKAVAFAEILQTFAGCSCADPPPDAFDAAPYELGDGVRAYFGFVDAALQGAPVPGLGGWLHGFFFSFPLPLDMLGYPIVQLEFLGNILGVMVFRLIVGLGRGVLVTDSETTSKILDNDGARTEQTQWLHEAFERTCATFGAFDQHRHGHGETNPFADLSSRGRLREMFALAAQMGIKVTRLPVPPAFLALLDDFRTEFGQRFAAPGALRQRLRVDRLGSLALPGAPVLNRNPPPPAPPAVLPPPEALHNSRQSAAARARARLFGPEYSSDETAD